MFEGFEQALKEKGMIYMYTDDTQKQAPKYTTTAAWLGLISYALLVFILIATFS